MFSCARIITFGDGPIGDRAPHKDTMTNVWEQRILNVEAQKEVDCMDATLDWLENVSLEVMALQSDLRKTEIHIRDAALRVKRCIDTINITNSESHAQARGASSSAGALSVVTASAVADPRLERPSSPTRVPVQYSIKSGFFIHGPNGEEEYVRRPDGNGTRHYSLGFISQEQARAGVAFKVIAADIKYRLEKNLTDDGPPSHRLLALNPAMELVTVGRRGVNQATVTRQYLADNAMTEKERQYLEAFLENDNYKQIKDEVTAFDYRTTKVTPITAQERYGGALNQVAAAF
jgi:hypothetical protein